MLLYFHFEKQIGSILQHYYVHTLHHLKCLRFCNSDHYFKFNCTSFFKTFCEKLLIDYNFILCCGYLPEVNFQSLSLRFNATTFSSFSLIFNVFCIILTGFALTTLSICRFGPLTMQTFQFVVLFIF